MKSMRALERDPTPRSKAKHSQSVWHWQNDGLSISVDEQAALSESANRKRDDKKDDGSSWSWETSWEDKDKDKNKEVKADAKDEVPQVTEAEENEKKREEEKGEEEK